MSTDREETMTEISVPQGTRTNEGDLVIGLGGVLLDPPRAMLSLSDRSRRDEEATHLTLAVGADAEYGGWRLSLLEIRSERGLDVARIAVESGRAR
jgi:hypothetical protein